MLKHCSGAYIYYKLWMMMMMRKFDTFPSYVALDDVTVLEAAELDAIALLADTRDNGLDPEEVHNWYKRAHKLTFPSGRRKGKVKAKERKRADILFARHIFHWRIVDGD